MAFELIGPPRKVDVYVGMSDRLPLRSRASWTILVAQNPHLYGSSTTRLTIKQRARLALLRRWSHASLRRADLIVTASSRTKHDIVATGLVPEATVVVQPIPPQDIPIREFGVSRKINRIMLLGDVYSYKRFDWAIQEIDRWAQGRHTVRIVHAGAAVEAEAWRRLTEVAASVSGVSVQFLGTIPHVDTIEIMSTCDLFVFPSDRESFGIPLAEALAVGLPSLCRDLPQFQEIAGPAASYFGGELGDLAMSLPKVQPQAIRVSMSALGRTRVPPNVGWKVDGRDG